MRAITHTSIVLTLLFLLVYSRFVNLGWGLPYPMHPDERNMADAVMKLRCDEPAELIRGVIRHAPDNVYRYLTIGELGLPNPKVECLNPHFFAYGQLSLFVGYFIANVIHVSGRILGEIPQAVQMSFTGSVMGLRIWSAIASCLMPFILIRILQKVNPSFQSRRFRYVALLLFIFSPVLIQFAHFGTTEAVLMLWYSILVYLAVVSIQRRKLLLRDLLLMAFVCGLAIATKASSLLYLVVPWMVILVKSTSDQMLRVQKHAKDMKDSPQQQEAPNTSQEQPASPEPPRKNIAPFFFLSWARSVSVIMFSVVFTTLVAGLVSFIFSPHNFISLRELLGSMHYESDVGLGNVIPFYTRQFLLELPVLFQTKHIFPYALGLPVFLFAVLGLVILPFNRSYNVLRFSVVAYAALTLTWYAKWTRFLAPVYPVIVIIAALTVAHIFDRLLRKGFSRRVTYGLGIGILLMCIVPGIAFLSVYSNRDVRFVASDWVYKNIPPGSYILSETANVIDIPIPDIQNKKQIPDGYHIQYMSFGSYDVDVDRGLQEDLQDAIAQADFIFVPSRRVFYNHTCVGLDGNITFTRHSKEKCAYLARTYPVLKKYYEDLFSGKSGFTKVAEFSSYPRIELFGKTILEFPDESAEETFTVFDHPVMRVYMRR